VTSNSGFSVEFLGVKSVFYCIGGVVQSPARALFSESDFILREFKRSMKIQATFVILFSAMFMFSLACTPSDNASPAQSQPVDSKLADPQAAKVDDDGSSDAMEVETSQGEVGKSEAEEGNVGRSQAAGRDNARAETSVDDLAKPSVGSGSELIAAKPLKILAWNIESGGANPDVIAAQLKQMPGYDIYGLSEVRPTDFPTIKAALGTDYYVQYSKSGFDDRLAFAIRKDRFDFIDQYEFTAFGQHVINPGNYRSPFVFEIKDNLSGKQFLVVLNHLARGKAEVRQEQALAIRMWAKDQAQPIIAIGDYNFDYVFATDKGNPAFDVFLEDDVFTWVRPVPMVDSNWYDEAQDGEDDYIDSLLDFVFVAGEAKTWNLKCQIIVREGDFPDDATTSDHRPVELIINP